MAPAVGSLLRWIASLTQPAQVLELGTGTGVSTGWLLAGLPAASVVTSVDADPASVMRPGGVLAMCIDAEHLDRELIAALNAHEAWTTTLATVGSGMCLAVWRPTSSDDGL